MEPTIFYSLQDFMLHSKTITYLLMGMGIGGMACFWYFLTGRDRDIKKF